MIWCALVGCAGCGLVLDSEGSFRTVDGSTADAGTGASDGSTGDAAPAMECTEASECEELFGAPPCGVWECRSELCAVVCADCADGDLDGYGVGAGCAAGDCDDADRALHDEATATCYEGPDGTMDVGACASGTKTCTDGAWTSCAGQVLPTAGEACNLIDDDCNGAIDDVPEVPCGYGACATTVPGCDATGSPALCTMPALTTADGCDGGDEDCDGTIDEDCGSCVWVGVGPTASDAPMDPLSPTTPFRTIQAAITYAATTAGAPKRVCVQAAFCGSPPTTYYESITMADGVSVHGSFTPTGEKCAGISTQLIGGTGHDEVVLFPNTIGGTAITELADMAVEHGRTGEAIKAISVLGARGVRITNVRVGPGGAAGANESTGIDVTDGGEAIVSRSAIIPHPAMTRAFGIRAREGARVEVRDNCPRDGLDPTDGRCDAECATASLGILSRVFGGTAPAAVEMYGVSLENAPGSIVDATLVCGNPTLGTGASVRITGDATGVVVSRNSIHAWGAGAVGNGVRMTACAGTAPRVVENSVIAAVTAAGATHTDGIHAEGDCHPVIDSNPDIIGHLEGRDTATGVHCAGGSRCFIRASAILGARPGTMPTRTIGVHCEGGSCARIEKSSIRGGAGGEVVGLLVEASDPLVASNRIMGGCGGSAGSFGVRLVDAPARLENNLIMAGNCTDAAPSPLYVGLDVQAGEPSTEPDVHSNILDGEGDPDACTSAAIRLRSSTGAAVMAGNYRSNAIRPGVCDTGAYHVLEVDGNADPRVFERNAFDTESEPFAYLDEGSSLLSSESDVDALGDTIARGTLDLACGYVMYPRDIHLSAESMCIGMGEPTAAPRFDVDLEPREDGAIDIGPDERVF